MLPPHPVFLPLLLYNNRPHRFLHHPRLRQFPHQSQKTLLLSPSVRPLQPLSIRSNKHQINAQQSHHAAIPEPSISPTPTRDSSRYLSSAPPVPLHSIPIHLQALIELADECRLDSCHEAARDGKYGYCATRQLLPSLPTVLETGLP